MLTKEGRRIKSSIPMDAMTPFIMPSRSGATNSFYATVDITEAEKFIRSKSLEGMTGLGMMHLIIAAYARVVSQFPGINRYIRGQRLYARNGIEVCLTIKKQLKLNAPESVIKFHIAPTDTLPDIYKMISEQLTENKKEGDRNSMDTAARILVSFPGLTLKSTVWFLRVCDYFGMLPRFLTNLSPFHGSMFISNLGSLGMPPIYHHLYNFGNLPMFITMGAKRTKYIINKNGETEKHRLLDFTIVCDERICDGHYYSCAFKLLKKLIENPQELFSPPDTVVEDIR